jgi:4-amino-4-deoxy-L-arabinose transferase-like glycosyltransferase
VRALVNPGLRVWRALALAVLAALAFLYAIAALTWPLGWDHGVFAWVGSTIAGGGMPFRDAWDVKGPASYLPFALVSALVGPLPWAYRLADLLALAGGALALRSVVRALGFPSLAPFAALVLVLTQASFGYWGTLQPDQWAGWLLTGAVALLLGRRESRWALAGFGVLVGVATLIKLHYAAFMLLPFVAAGIERTWRLRTIVLGFAGAALPLMVCVVWFWAKGALPELVDGYILFNLDTWRLKEFQDVSALQGLSRVAARLPVLLPLLPLALLGIAESWRTDRSSAAILACWLGLTVGGVVLQGRWFIYQWAPVVPALIGSGTLALGPILRMHPSRRRVASAIVAALVLLVLGFTARRLFTAGRNLSVLALERDRSDYLRRFPAPVPEYSAAEVEHTAEVLARMTRPEDCVLVWSDPVVNALSDRPIPGRFATFVPLTMGRLTPRREKYRAEFLNSLITLPPRLILIDSFTLSSTIRLRGELTTRFPAFLDLVHTRYRSTGTLGKYAVWTARESARATCH